MKQKKNSLDKKTSCYLRSSKSKDEKDLLSKFEGTLKSNKNKSSFRFLEETINDMSQKNNSLKKSKKESKSTHSPSQEFKRSQSVRNKTTQSKNGNKNSEKEKGNKDNKTKSKENVTNKAKKDKNKEKISKSSQSLNTGNKKGEKILEKNELKKLKRSGNYTYVKNDIDYKDKKKKDFVIVVNKTEEIKKLLNQHIKFKHV